MGRVAEFGEKWGKKLGGSWEKTGRKNGNLAFPRIPQILGPNSQSFPNPWVGNIWDWKFLGIPEGIPMGIWGWDGIRSKKTPEIPGKASKT